jgi:hypothetical protein
LDCIATDRGVTGPGIQVFQIHGALYHQTGPLEELEGGLPQYAQLYFHDPQYAASARHQRYSRLRLSTFQGLTAMLHESGNPYIKLYRTARERLRQAANDSRVVLTSNLEITLETGADRRRENVPASDEVGLVIPDAAAAETSRPIVLAARNSNALYTISAAHPSYMPLHYVLMFPHGDKGWYPGMMLRNVDGSLTRDKLTQQMYYRYYLQTRPGATTVPFLYYRLFQQFLVDIWALLEQSRLQWVLHNQNTLRAELYSGVADAVARDDGSNIAIGRRIVLPSSYLGSSRSISGFYQDSMAIVRNRGGPVLFITFTASGFWPEVDRELRYGETGVNRPDLVCRAFHLKSQELLKDVKAGLFGEHRGHVYTINVRGQAEDSRKARVNHDEFDEELSEQEGRLAL